MEAVALEGRTLWYQYVPASAETLTVLYYRDPTSLSADSDEPSDFPDFVHRKLFTHGPAFIGFTRIEDGLEESERINSKTHFWHAFDEKNLNSGIVKLREWIAKCRVNKKSGVWRY